MCIDVMNCHERLSYFIENFDLVNQADPIQSSNERFDVIIGKYLINHKEQFTEQDLPNLKEIGDKSPILVKICETAIAVINEKKKTPLENVKNVFDLMTSYLSINDLINLHLIGKIHDELVIKRVVADTAVNYPKGIEDFATYVIEKFNFDPDTATAMIQIFLTHSTSEAQKIFFAFNFEDSFFKYVYKIATTLQNKQSASRLVNMVSKACVDNPYLPYVAHTVGVESVSERSRRHGVT